ncbi:MAG TPA: insulinase family protein, partial [Bryobacteraceae bacterium]|nr:insulinase family protein [Bryobacteraceae bacterium]
MRQGTALLWAAVFAATLLNAQEKEKPPQGSAPKPFTLPSAQKFTLKNGTRVTMVPYGLAPKVSVRVIVNAGNGQEGPNQIWLADFTGEILKEGTATRTAEQIAQEAAAMGGGVNITVGPDGTTIGGDALSEFAPSLVGLLADVVQHPLIPASELPRIRTNFLRTLAIQRSRPSALAAEAFAKAIYGDHSYGRIYPTEAMLK